MKIDPKRLQLASAMDSDSESRSSREEGEIRSVDLPPPPSPARDPRHEAYYKLQDELRLGLPRFAQALHWANTLKETGGGPGIQFLVLLRRIFLVRRHPPLRRCARLRGTPRVSAAVLLLF
jgi:hypothetical protein